MPLAQASPWHAGERAVQRRVGEVELADRATGLVRSTVPDVAVEFLARQRMLVVAAAVADGMVWASLLTGPPGFLRVPQADVLDVAARPGDGDPLHEVLAGPAPVGAIAIEPATRRRMRLNGRASPRGQGLRIDLEQVYANCPKYIQQREVVEAAPGGATGSAGAVVGDRLTERQRRWVGEADTFFIGTADASGNADASHRGGSPAFVQVLGPDHLRFPDYRGNSMYMTLGNLEQNSAAGLLFVDWTTGAVLQVSGTATVDYTPEATAGAPGAQRMVELRVARTVETLRSSRLAWGAVTPSRSNPPVRPS
jgi:predicted pyridoxine 5'-phosphate oxidase superfamily flavin-nucleotide-binding protein